MIPRQIIGCSSDKRSILPAELLWTAETLVIRNRLGRWAGVSAGNHDPLLERDPQTASSMPARSSKATSGTPSIPRADRAELPLRSRNLRDEKDATIARALQRC
jgi:hypothetical protein